MVRPSLGGISVLLVRGPESGGARAACPAQCPVALTHVSPRARSEAHGQVLSVVLVCVGFSGIGDLLSSCFSSLGGLLISYKHSLKTL